MLLSSGNLGLLQKVEVTWTRTPAGRFCTGFRPQACFSAQCPGAVIHPPGSDALAKSAPAPSRASPWDLVKILQHAHAHSHYLTGKSVQLCLPQLVCQARGRRSRKPYRVSAFCGNSHLSDTNHLIICSFYWLSYRPWPHHLDYLPFENIVYLNICSGILTG